MKGLVCRAGGVSLILLFLIGVGTAGPATVLEEEWNVTFNEGTYTHIQTVEQTRDGGFIMGGLGYGEEDDAALLIQTDVSGTPLWMQRYQGDYIVAVAEDPSGGYMLAAYEASVTFERFPDMDNATGSSWLIRADDQGNVIWEQKIENWRISDMIVTPEGEYVIAGWVWGGGGMPSSFLARYAPDGSERWSSTFEGGAVNAVEGVEDGYILAGSTSLDPDEHAAAWVLGTDAAGGERWQTTASGTSVRAMTVSDDGSVALGGSLITEAPDMGPDAIEERAWMATIDSEGDEVWSTTVKGVTILSLAPAPDGGFVAAGQWGESGHVQWIDSSGTLVSELIYKDWRGKLNAVCRMTDGGYAVGGWTGMNGVMEGWLVSIASLQAEEVPSPTPAQTPGFQGVLALIVLFALFAVMKIRGR